MKKKLGGGGAGRSEYMEDKLVKLLNAKLISPLDKIWLPLACEGNYVTLLIKAYQSQRVAFGFV